MLIKFPARLCHLFGFSFLSSSQSVKSSWLSLCLWDVGSCVQYARPCLPTEHLPSFCATAICLVCNGSTKFVVEHYNWDKQYVIHSQVISNLVLTKDYGLWPTTCMMICVNQDLTQVLVGWVTRNLSCPSTSQSANPNSLQGTASWQVHQFTGCAHCCLQIQIVVTLKSAESDSTSASSPFALCCKFDKAFVDQLNIELSTLKIYLDLSHHSPVAVYWTFAPTIVKLGYKLSTFNTSMYKGQMQIVQWRWDWAGTCQ